MGLVYLYLYCAGAFFLIEKNIDETNFAARIKT